MKPIPKYAFLLVRVIMGWLGVQILILLIISACTRSKTHLKPNFIFAITDDQGFPHASAYGCRFVETPAFDRIAREGVLFQNAYCAIPQCSPNRASILTGRYLWQNQEGGTHASLFPAHLRIFTDPLIHAGYEMASTGKTWAPGTIDKTNRLENKDLIGKQYDTENPSDHWKDFEKFFAEADPDNPFFFWMGTSDPHRPFEKGAGLASGKKLEDVDIPPYLPDNEAIRSDFLDYAVMIERFDRNLQNIIRILEETGELENTVIIVTSDNGMPFPRAKGNAYDAGVHVPMAIRWGNRVPAGQVIDDLISHIDLAPTILDIAGLPAFPEIEGKSFLDLLLHPKSTKNRPFRESLFYGRERATSARPDNVGYPVRTIRTPQYELVWNLKPDRYPTGNQLHESEGDVVKAEIIRMKDENPQSRKIYEDAYGFRPEFELHDMLADPDALVNLAGEPRYQAVFDSLFNCLKQQLIRNGDPRMLGQGDIWESYPRFGSIRDFGGDHPAFNGVYNDHYVRPGQRIPQYLFDSKAYTDYYTKTGITKEMYIDKLLHQGAVLY